MPFRDSSWLLESASDATQGCIGNLLCVVFFDLIESKEGILGRELPLEGVKEDLVLGELRFAGL